MHVLFWFVYEVWTELTDVCDLNPYCCCLLYFQVSSVSFEHWILVWRKIYSVLSSLLIENQVGDYLEGVPFYSPRNDISGPENGNRIAGIKRSHPDSAFMGSYRNQIPHVSLWLSWESHAVKVSTAFSFFAHIHMEVKRTSMDNLI